MIIIQLPNTVPTPAHAGLATRQNATVLSIPAGNLNDVCYCEFECDYIEKVFAAAASTDWWKNDKSSFLQRKIVAADTINFEIWSDTEKLDDLDSTTYGTYYSTFVAKPLYKGYLVDWKMVYTALGFGTYQIKAQKSILGVVSTWESQLFKLTSYDDYDADGTIRIECYQDGNIMSSEFDYTGLVDGGWYQSYRIGGHFGKKTPKLTTDNYLTSEYELLQIQDKITPEWTLETSLIPAFISNQIIYDNLLSNKVLITDYNIMNAEIYRRISLYPSEITETKNFKNNRNQKFTVKFTNKKDNIIKSNF